MIKKGTSIVGYGENRESSDFYPTPEYVTEALLEREKFVGSIWEPASGDGSMSKVLEKYYGNVTSSDIRTGKDVYGYQGIDFLTTPISKTHNIVTNPPFKYGKDFVIQAKKIACFKIAMFLKLSFLEGAKRHDFFKDKDFPLKKIYVFSKRVTLSPKGIVPKNKGLIAYAWYVWDKEHEGEATINWIL